MSSNKEAEAQICATNPSEIPSGRKSLKTAVCTVVEAVKKFAKEQKGSFGFLKEPEYKNDVKKLWDEFRDIITRGAATAAVAVTVCVVVNLLGWNPGYEVYVDGENIGQVTDKAVVFEAIDAAAAEVKAHLGEDEAYEKEPVFVSRIVSDYNVASKAKLTDSLLSNVDALVGGYVVYIDGKAVFGVETDVIAEDVLLQYKQNASGAVADDVTVGFCEKIEIKKEYMEVGMLKSPENALAIISGTDKRMTIYVVRPADTVSGIAGKFGTSVEQILALNKNISKGIKAGMELNIEEDVPVLTIKHTQTVSRTEPVPFDVEQIEDSSLYEGRTVVEQEGKQGTSQVMARVTTVDGVEIDKKILSSRTLTQPVVQIEKIGTKERPATTGSGTFTNPTAGNLSSRYGARWDRKHNGIDICGALNTAIKAADGGLVTYAGWMDGYGNYVIIDHENGYQTAYAHCNSIDVAVGDRVTKGEEIAKMGSTGRSTGVHLHFEVKKNGEFVNPLEYVGY
ncbi:MAG: peptidoglycan DD-metalloendopeptidase family protein [Clostridia bacterium]|nr:peptidoglycan DD-metalloendopeptidase family protein [Clostridia bacterium]